MTTKPHPGSNEAIALGCTCPVLDNSHGAGLGDGLFYINGDCPIHAYQPERTSDGDWYDDGQPHNGVESTQTPN